MVRDGARGASGGESVDRRHGCGSARRAGASGGTGGTGGVVGATGASGSGGGGGTNSYGMIMSNDSGTPNTILDVSAGVRPDSTFTTAITLAAFTKSIAGSWTAGSGNHTAWALRTAPPRTISTWYHVFAIINSGSADVYFDTSISAANAPASTTAFARIGSIFLDGSGHITPFLQEGNFFFVAAVQFYSGFGLSQTLESIFVPPEISVLPLPLEATASGNFQQQRRTQEVVAAPPADSSFATLVCESNIDEQFPCWKLPIGPPTNTSQQIYLTVTTTGSASGATASVVGWIEPATSIAGVLPVQPEHRAAQAAWGKSGASRRDRSRQGGNSEAQAASASPGHPAARAVSGQQEPRAASARPAQAEHRASMVRTEGRRDNKAAPGNRRHRGNRRNQAAGASGGTV